MKDVYCTKIDNARPQKSATECIDREILWSMRQKKPIRLDKAFPDIGLFENDARSCAVAPTIKKRMRSMRGKGYQKEFIYRTTHRLALRGIDKLPLSKRPSAQIDCMDESTRYLSSNYDKRQCKAIEERIYRRSGGDQ